MGQDEHNVVKAGFYNNLYFTKNKNACEVFPLTLREGCKISHVTIIIILDWFDHQGPYVSTTFENIPNLILQTFVHVI